MVSIENNHNEYTARPEPSRSRPVSVVAMIVGVGIAAVLLWMNLSLSSHVSKLEESIVTLQKSLGGEAPSNKLAEVNSQLDKLTQLLSDHLDTRSAGKEMAQNPSAVLPSSNKEGPAPQDTSSPAADRPIQATPADTVPTVATDQAKNKRALPAPISTPDATQTKPASGNWVVNLASVSSAESADREVARLGKMDIKAEVSRAESKGKTWYRIQVPGYGSYDEAINARPALEEKLGISGTWVGQSK